MYTLYWKEFKTSSVSESPFQRGLLGQVKGKMSTEKRTRGSGSRQMNVLGFVHVPFGLVIAVLGLAAVGVDRNDVDRLEMIDKVDRQYIILGLDCACVVSGFWIICTGMFPCCSCTDPVKTNIMFMVFNIVTAVLFFPVTFGSAVAGYLLRDSNSWRLVTVPAMLAVVSFLELFLAIASSCFSCCYYPWQGPGRSSNWKKYMSKFMSGRKVKKADERRDEIDEDEKMTERKDRKMEKKRIKAEKKAMKADMKADEEKKMKMEEEKRSKTENGHLFCLSNVKINLPDETKECDCHL